jgi:hypothetical protein
MVRVAPEAARDMKAAVLRKIMISRKRAKASAQAMRDFQLSWFQSQSLAVLAALALTAAGEKKDRRVVPRALGKWRGSTLSGYLTHDDQTYVERFRCTRAQLQGLVDLLHGSQLDSAENQRIRALAIRTPPPGAAAPSPRRLRRTKVARDVHDLPSLRYKIALCMYTLGHGGPIKVIADAGSVGESSLRRYLGLFALGVMHILGPVYMPATPFTASELEAVQGQFASRRGIKIASMAVDGSHIPFKPKNKTFAMDYRNFKGWTSILAVAFVDSFYRFFDVDVGYPGRAGDNTVLSRNPLLAKITANPDKWLGKGGVILGDSGASDSDRVFLNPFHCPTEPEKCWFNFCHSSTRFFVEQTFGIWKSRFRFLLHSLPGLTHKLFTQLIYASAILHNYLIATRDGSHFRDVDASDAHWSSFFTKYQAHMCPSCKRDNYSHCVHQAGYRNGHAQAAQARKAPSKVRDELCAALWAEVCNDSRVCRNMAERAKNPLSGL